MITTKQEGHVATFCPAGLAGAIVVDQGWDGRSVEAMREGAVNHQGQVTNSGVGAVRGLVRRQNAAAAGVAGDPQRAGPLPPPPATERAVAGAIVVDQGWDGRSVEAMREGAVNHQGQVTNSGVGAVRGLVRRQNAAAAGVAGDPQRAGPPPPPPATERAVAGAIVVDQGWDGASDVAPALDVVMSGASAAQSRAEADELNRASQAGLRSLFAPWPGLWTFLKHLAFRVIITGCPSLWLTEPDPALRAAFLSIEDPLLAPKPAPYVEPQYPNPCRGRLIVFDTSSLLRLDFETLLNRVSRQRCCQCDDTASSLPNPYCHLCDIIVVHSKVLQEIIGLATHRYKGGSSLGILVALIVAAATSAQSIIAECSVQFPFFRLFPEGSGLASILPEHPPLPMRFLGFALEPNSLSELGDKRHLSDFLIASSAFLLRGLFGWNVSVCTEDWESSGPFARLKESEQVPVYRARDFGLPVMPSDKVVR